MKNKEMKDIQKKKKKKKTKKKKKDITILVKQLGNCNRFSGSN